jgi:hypothetical protein
LLADSLVPFLSSTLYCCFVVFWQGGRDTQIF